MDTATLRKVIGCAKPTGLTTEKDLVFSFESFAASARLQGIAIGTRRDTFKALRSMGFVDVKRGGERQISASLRVFLLIAYPVWQQWEKQVLGEVEHAAEKD